MPTFFVQVPSLEERAMCEHGKKFLEGVCYFRRGMLDPTPMRISRRHKCSERKIHDIARTLENAGYVDLHYAGPTVVRRIKLTEKGKQYARENGLDIGMGVGK